MPTLLKAGRIEADPWRYLDGDEDLPTDGPVVVSWSRWQSISSTSTGGPRPGLWLDVDQEPHVVAEDLPYIPLVCIRFPVFSDGRGLSLAVLLRTRHRYRGEIRAIGAVHEDLTRYLLRCGFDSLLLPDGRNVEAALRASVADGPFYQGSVQEPRPAFRRIARGL